jgi:hypothetical protein
VNSGLDLRWGLLFGSGSDFGFCIYVPTGDQAGGAGWLRAVCDRERPVRGVHGGGGRGRGGAASQREGAREPLRGPGHHVLVPPQRHGVCSNQD